MTLFLFFVINVLCGGSKTFALDSLARCPKTTLSIPSVF